MLSSCGIIFRYIFRSEWNDEEVLKCIHELKKYRCLWDPKDEGLKSKIKKMTRVTNFVYNLKNQEKKKDYQFNPKLSVGYRRKIKTSKVSGAGRCIKNNVFSIQCHYNTFMEDVNTPHYGTIDTMVITL